MPPHHPSPCPPCSCLSAPDGDSSVSQQEVARPPPSSPVLHRSPPLALRSPASIDVHSRLTSSPTVTARGCDNGLSSLQESARHAHRATCLAHYPPPPPGHSPTAPAASAEASAACRKRRGTRRTTWLAQCTEPYIEVMEENSRTCTSPCIESGGGEGLMEENSRTCTLPCAVRRVGGRA